MYLQVPLRRPPQVTQVGLSVHGRLARERYRMPGLWGIHLYHYSGSVDIDGQRLDFKPGCITVTPPDTELVWRFPPHAPHHYALLRFTGARDEDQVQVPALTDLGGGAAGYREAVAIDRVVAAFAHDPQRAHAWAWDLLWRLVPSPCRVQMVSGVPGTDGKPVPPALQNVLTMMELELDRPHALTGLARRAGISPNHLLRLFHQHCGDSVMGWLRRRRGERARELLTTTSLPIPDVAKAVGCADLQTFNKLVRRVCGASPRQLRG